MEESITINQKDIREIISKWYEIPLESIVQSKYSITIIGKNNCEIVRNKMIEDMIKETNEE